MKKKFFATLILLTFVLSSFSQPESFSWFSNDNNLRFNYISPAKDQGEQGPCRTFTAVAAVEAMSHIYYNKPFSPGTNGINLSEAEIYSGCSGYGGPAGSASIEEALYYIDTTGIINESCFAYPDNSPFFRTDCASICPTPSYEVNIPGFEQLNLTTAQALKRAIIDYGPIATFLANSGYELHGSVDDYNHAVLIIGWDGSQWHIKDSWTGEERITYTSINVFDQEFSAQFFRVKYENGGSVISCSGSGCSSVFSSRSWTDNDGDGFYNWGIGDKPTGCPGPCEMDFNDADGTTIFLDASYNLRLTPELDCPGYACTAGSTFRLTHIPPGFSVSWSVSPSSYFNSSTGGNDSVAVLYPKTMYTGSKGTITFTISDGCSSLVYSKTFTINMPEPEEISINVVPSSAPDPIYFSEVWLLCPNSSYYIYLNNTSGCSTTNYQWTIPSQWTKYAQTSNYIRINTNNTPGGVVTVTATTCCNTSHLVKHSILEQATVAETI